MDILPTKSPDIVTDVKDSNDMQDDGFSMDDLLSAMRSHLFKREDSFRRLFGDERSRCPAMRAPRPADDCSRVTEVGEANDNKSLRSGAGCVSHNDYDQYKQINEETCKSLDRQYDLTSSSVDKVGTGAQKKNFHSPRLCSPFYEELSRKYPNAFRRRSPRNGRTESSNKVSHHSSHSSVNGDMPKEGEYYVQRLVKQRQEFDESDSERPLQGILKKDRSASSSQLNRSDSTLSLKDRFAQNSRTLQHLLSKENLPFRTRVKSRSKSRNEPEMCETLQRDSNCERKLHKGRKLYKSEEQLQNKGVPHRMVSPESPHDSAVDMDSASLQSSPSTDVHGTVTWPVSMATDSLSPIHQNSGFTNDILDMELTRLKDKKEMVMTSTSGKSGGRVYTDHDSQQNFDETLSPASSGQRDSDVDSGIAQSYNSHSNHGNNVNRGQSSNGDENFDSISQKQHTGVNNTPLLSTTHVKNTFRTQRTRTQTPKCDSTTKTGPVKADHNLQPVTSPAHQRHSYDMEQWLLQGARPKHSSIDTPRSHRSSNQNGKQTPRSPRDSPNARVHFLDETLEMDYLAETLELKGNNNKSNRYIEDDEAQTSSRQKKENSDYRRESDILNTPTHKTNSMQKHYAHMVTIEQSEQLKSDRLSGRNSDSSSTLKNTDSRTPIPYDNYSINSDVTSVFNDSNTDTESMVVGISEKKAWQPLAHSVAMDYWSSSCEDLSRPEIRKPRSRKFRLWKKSKGQYEPNQQIRRQEFYGFSQSKSSHIQRPAPMVKSASLGCLANHQMPHPPSEPRSQGQAKRSRPSSASAKMKSADSAMKQGQSSNNMTDELIAERNKRVEQLFKNYTSQGIQSVQQEQFTQANGRRCNSINDLRSSQYSMNPSHERSDSQSVCSDVVVRRKHHNAQSQSMEDVRLSQGRNSSNTRPQASLNQKSKKNSKVQRSNPGVAMTSDDSITQMEVPPSAKRGNYSDLEKHQDLSGSRTSLSNRVDSFRENVKSKLNKLRKAVSLERVDQGSNLNENEGEKSKPKLKKSSSLRSLRNLFKKRDSQYILRNAENSGSGYVPAVSDSNLHLLGSKNTLTSVDASQRFRAVGKLCQINPDGTQLIQLTKPENGPFGFYIARGNKRYNHGIFISRMSDGYAEKVLAGLLGVGDEILEINNMAVQKLSLDTVYDVMAQSQLMLLKTLPFLARRDF